MNELKKVQSSMDCSVAWMASCAENVQFIEFPKMNAVSIGIVLLAVWWSQREPLNHFAEIICEVGIQTVRLSNQKIDFIAWLQYFQLENDKYTATSAAIWWNQIA